MTDIFVVTPEVKQFYGILNDETKVEIIEVQESLIIAKQIHNNVSGIFAKNQFRYFNKVVTENVQVEMFKTKNGWKMISTDNDTDNVLEIVFGEFSIIEKRFNDYK